MNDSSLVFVKLLKKESVKTNLYRNRNKYSIYFFKSIVNLAKKQNIDPNQLAKSIALATRDGVSNCGDLIIKCREINKDSAILLITSKNKIVAQFPVKLGILNNCIKLI